MGGQGRGRPSQQLPEEAVTQRQDDTGNGIAGKGKERVGVAGAWATRRHFGEQVAGDGVPELGCHFWHIPCKFGSGALKQSCSPLDALQLVFRVQGH